MPIRVNWVMCLLINVLFMSRAFSQYTPVLESLRSELESGKQEQAFLQLKKMKIPSSTPDKALYYFLLAKCNDIKNNHQEAFSGYLKAKEYYIAADSIGRAMDINLDIAFSIDLQKNTKHDYTKYIDEYFAYATKQNDSLRLAKGYAHMAAQRIDRKQYTESLKYFKLARAINSRVKDKDLEISINSNLAVLYNEDLNKPDSALYYLRKNVDYLKQENRSEDLCYNY
ncbi:MAG: tetratricopeptide repeat protein, partial [Flavobacterium sp.]